MIIIFLVRKEEAKKNFLCMKNVTENYYAKENKIMLMNVYRRLKKAFMNLKIKNKSKTDDALIIIWFGAFILLIGLTFLLNSTLLLMAIVAIVSIFTTKLLEEPEYKIISIPKKKTKDVEINEIQRIFEEWEKDTIKILDSRTSKLAEIKRR